MVAIRISPRRPRHPRRSRNPAGGRWSRARRHAVRRLGAARLGHARCAVRPAATPAAGWGQAMIGLRSKRTTELLPGQSVTDGALVLSAGSLTAVLACPTP